MMNYTFWLKLVDRFGERIMLFVGSTIEIVAFIVFTITQAALHLAPQALSYLAIAAAGLFLAGSNFLL